MQSLVPQFGQSTRLIVFTPPFLKIIPNGLHSLLPHQVGKFNTKFPTFQKPISFQKNNLKPTIASKPLFTKKTGIIASRGFATNNSEKEDVKVEVKSSKNSIFEIEEIETKQVASYLSMFSIGLAFAGVAALKIPLITYLSMNGCAIAFGSLAMSIQNSSWYKGMVSGGNNQVLQMVNRFAVFSSGVSVGANLMFFLPYSIRHLALYIQVLSVGTNLFLGVSRQIPKLMKELPTVNWSEVFAEVKYQWNLVWRLVRPFVSTAMAILRRLISGFRSK